MILVTGATGRLGTKLVESLLMAGQPVRALIRNADKADSFRAVGVSVVLGDLNQPNDIVSALDGCDRLMSIPPNTLTQAQQEIYLFQAAKRTDIKQVIKLSTVKANLRSACFFFRQHAIAEQYLQQSGLRFTILQSNSFMQNFLWFTPEISNRGTLSLPMQDSKVAPVDVGDVANVAHVLLTEKRDYPTETYNITGPTILSFKDIAAKLIAVFGKEVTYVDIPSDDFRQTLLQIGLQKWYAEAIVSAWEVASREQPTVTDAVQSITKKQPTTFEQFAETHRYAFNPLLAVEGN